MQYKILKNIRKTADANPKLELASESCLLDFSLLEQLAIEDWEKAEIRKKAAQITPAFTTEYYGCLHDTFSACDGIAEFSILRVFSAKTGNRLYIIGRLEEIKHYSKSRSSLYENRYDVKGYHIGSLRERNLPDIEL